jgi:hypothetical protein
MLTIHRALFAAVLAACAPASSPPRSVPAGVTSAPAAASTAPRYRTVHIDTLSPERAAQFVDARHAWLAAVTKAGGVDRRGSYLQVDGDRFFSMRPLARFAELDARGAEYERDLAPVPKSAGEAYDTASDTALVFPHASEIWRVDDDLAYVPPAGPLDETTACCGRLIVEEARPDPASQERYEKAWAETKAGLAAAKYPLARVTYRSAFGAGRLVTFWFARSNEELAAAPTVEAAIARALGSEKADALKRATEASVVRREEHAVTRRADLSSP